MSSLPIALALLDGLAQNRPIPGLLVFADRPSLSGIELNCTLSETHRTNYEISQVPIESGAVLTDHIQRQPTQLSMEGVISARPDNIADQARRGSSVTERGVRGLQKYSAEDRANTSWARLNNLADAKLPFTVTTALQVYKDMVFVSLETVEDGDDALIFRAELRQIEIVDIRREKYLEQDFKDDGDVKDVLGLQSTVEITDTDVLGQPGVTPFSVVA
jgi:hypothetical protein